MDDSISYQRDKSKDQQSTETPKRKKTAILTDNRSSSLSKRKLVDSRTTNGNVSQFKYTRPIQHREQSEDLQSATSTIDAPTLRQSPNYTGMPNQLKAGIESLSGYSLDDVKVHFNSRKPAQLQSHAYAQGNHIHLAPGQEKHLPHEAWHVVQQKQGRVNASFQLKGININDDLGMEQEADKMGTLAQSFQHHPGSALIQKTSDSETVQAVGWESLGWLNPRRYVPEALGGYDAKTMERIRKKELVSEVVTKNVKAGKEGWFYLNEEQFETYTDRVYDLLDEIRNTDMNVLMIAHQQVNMEAELSPEEKLVSLKKHLQTTEREIAKLGDFDVDFLRKSKNELEGKRRLFLKNTPNDKEGIQELTDMIAELSNKIISLNKKEHGGEEVEKVKTLSTHKRRMEREIRLQEAQKGKEGINIDFLNTTETDEKGNEFVRLYMSIVAPDFDNKFKDFYLTDTQKPTYSAKDKVMWIGFGTPFRQLSWLQKYAFEAKGDNVPLIRSFAVPIKYFEKHMQRLSTEAAETEKGTVKKTKSVDVDLEKYYGPEFSGQTYSSEVNAIDPYPMNVDVKYPNQFGLGRMITTEERPKDRGFFDKTKKEALDRSELLAHGNYDEQIESMQREIDALQEMIKKVNDKTYEDKKSQELDQAITESLANFELDKLKVAPNIRKYLLRLKNPEEESQETEVDVNDEFRRRVLRILESEKFEQQITLQNELLKEIKKKDTGAKESVKKITTGDSSLKAHVANVTEEIETSKDSEVGQVSTAMADLLKYAIPGSFKTIALAYDRNFEHLPDKEGELQDYPDFMSSLGLNHKGKQPVSHFLDSRNTAFHSLDKDGDWASQTPNQTDAIYSKMRFFFHGLDSRISAIDPLASEKETGPLDAPDISFDSHLKEVVKQIKAKNISGEKMIALNEIYLGTNVLDTLSDILNMNHLTPADVFGLPKNLQSGRRDRHGNLMIRSAAETFLAEKTIVSETSLNFIADNSQKIISAIENPTATTELLEDLLNNSYLRRDIQELLGEKLKNQTGMKQQVPYTKAEIVKALKKIEQIKSEKDPHAQLRMVYLFFHILRPLAQKLGSAKKPTITKPKEHVGGDLAGSDLEVNNRTEELSHFNFLNPRTKAFGLLDSAPDEHDSERYMPYDKFRSTHRYVPKEGSKMTKYMRARELPFVGGVSGTTRDQSKVLEAMFGKETLEKHYWDFQLMNAAFMIGNAYHSFFEAIYVAARYDTYTSIGEKVLAEFDEANQKDANKFAIYVKILKLISPDKDLFSGFEKWYQEKTKNQKSDGLDTQPWIDYRSKRIKSAQKPVGTQSLATTSHVGTGKGSKSLPKTTSTTPTRPNISSQYLYEDNDIQAILSLMVQQHNLQNVHVMAAVDDIAGGELYQRLQADFATNQGLARKLLIPYNLGRYHWIGILVNIGANEETVTVEVMDPNQGTVGYVAPPRVTDEVKRLYAEATITSAAHLLQQDGTSCGVLTIENLINRARGENLGQDQRVARGAEVLRKAHVDLMSEHRPEDNFSHRQKFELYTFSSFDVRKYISGKGNHVVSKSEITRVFQIINELKEFGNHEELIKAFTILNQDGKTLQDALTPIRNAFNVTLAVTKENGTKERKTTLLDILKSVFEISGNSLDTVQNVNDLKVNNVSLIENIATYAEKAPKEQKKSEDENDKQTSKL